MTVTDSHQFRPSRLWKLVSPAHRLDTALAFWREGDEATRTQAIYAIARHLKFRHKSVMALPDDRKARHLASLPVVPDVVASRLLIIYHLATKRPMMAAFLPGCTWDRPRQRPHHGRDDRAARCRSLPAGRA